MLTSTGAVEFRWSFRPKITCWIYFGVIEPKLLYAVAFWWSALNKLHVRLLDEVRSSAELHITGALRTTVLLAEPATKFPATTLDNYGILFW